MYVRGPTVIQGSFQMQVDVPKAAAPGPIRHRTRMPPSTRSRASLHLQRNLFRLFFLTCKSAEMPEKSRDLPHRPRVRDVDREVAFQRRDVLVPVLLRVAEDEVGLEGADRREIGVLRAADARDARERLASGECSSA